MRALQRLVMIVSVVSLTVGATWQAAHATPLLSERGVLNSSDASLDDGSLYDRHEFSGVSGQRIIIYLESEEFDPYLILLDPGGKRISENDDISRSNRNSRLSITLPATGVYTIIANSYEPGRSGRYSLEVNSSDSSARSERDRFAITPAIAREMVADAVPGNSVVCDERILSAMDELQRDRELGILVDAVQLRRYFSGQIPRRRPNGIRMGLNGPAALSIMFSPQLLTHLSTEMIQDCTTIGAVFFESPEADFERVFGDVSGSRNNPEISEFDCQRDSQRGSQRGSRGQKPAWGERLCL